MQPIPSIASDNYTPTTNTDGDDDDVVPWQIYDHCISATNHNNHSTSIITREHAGTIQECEW